MARGAWAIRFSFRVERQKVEVYRQPDPETESYSERTTVGGAEVLGCQSVPELHVPLAEVW